MQNDLRGAGRATHDEPGRLIDNNRVRVLNCSADGCLLETTRAVPPNTVAALSISVDGRVFEDLVRVLRCEALTTGGSVYHLAAHFVSVTPPATGSLRYEMRKESSLFRARGRLDE